MLATALASEEALNISQIEGLISSFVDDGVGNFANEHQHIIAKVIFYICEHVKIISREMQGRKVVFTLQCPTSIYNDSGSSLNEIIGFGENISSPTLRLIQSMIKDQCAAGVIGVFDLFPFHVSVGDVAAAHGKILSLSLAT